MALNNFLLSQFAKTVAPKKETPKESTAYGTIVEFEGRTYAKIDGSDRLTPISTTTATNDGDRVTVMIKDHQAMVTGNISDPSASSKEVTEISDQITKFEIVIADKVTTEELEAEKARINDLITDNLAVKERLTADEAVIEDLEAKNVTITGDLTAVKADIKTLEAEKVDAEFVKANYATIGDLEATNAYVYNFEATYGEFADLTTTRLDAAEATIDNLDATYATISQLDAEKARINDLEANALTANSAVIKNLEADVADIDTLIFGSASGNVIQTSFANAVIAQLGNAQIKSAMIENLSASKITSGDIITNNVRVMSEDGSLIISDETIQISDDTRVRVQIGKDASNDYSINIWDADGNLMFSEGGITDDAIKDAIIRDDMVSDTANISAHKLNITSLFEEINGSTQTINSSKIFIDADNQTLDVAFDKMITNLDSLSGNVTSMGTDISVIQGQISSKIWMEDIIESTFDVDIGGRNLFEKTSSDWIDTDVSRWSGGIDYYVNGEFRRGTLTSFEELGFRVGDNYTIGLELNAIHKSIKLRVDLYKENALGTGYATGFSKVVSVGNSEKVTYTNTVSEEYPYFVIYVGNHDTTDATTTTEQYRQLKMEKGNIATDWTPAPEDMESEVSTLKTQYSDIVQDIDSITATVSSHTTQISNKADSSTVTAVNNKVSNLELSLDGFRTTVSNTYATISDVDDLSSRMSSAETSITQNTNKIGLMATKTEVENKLEDYYTIAETEAAIDVSASEIKSTVSNTYATKTALNTTNSNVTKAQNAANAAQTDVDNLETRVGTAETKITQNANNITSQASTINSHTSKISTLEQTASGLTTRVTNVETDADNAIAAAANAQNDIDDLAIGARNLVIFDDIVYHNAILIDGNTTEYIQFSSSGQYDGISISADVFELNTEYVLQYDLTLLSGDGSVGGHSGIASSAAMYIDGVYKGAYANPISLAKDTKIHVEVYITTGSSIPGTPNVYIQSQRSVSSPITMECLVENLKLEKGNRPTNWTPAPEDMTTSKRMEISESLIAQMSDNIQMLVTDGTGASLMTQTADGGWTFSMAETNNTVNNLSQQLNDLQTLTGNVNSTVTILQQTVTDIGATMEYVRIGTWEGEPCIELGESDSDYSLMITNTRILFRVGSNTPTKVTTYGLVTDNIEVAGEIKQGGFVHIITEDGGWGLLWRGVDG